MGKPHLVLWVLKFVIKRQSVVVFVTFAVPILILHVPVSLSLVGHCSFDGLDWVLALLIHMIG